MKIFTLTSLFVLCLVCIFSCKKISSSPNQQPPPSTKRARIQSSATGLNSTVLLITYNQAGNITSVNDSVNGVNYVASYDANGNLVHIVQMKSGAAGDSATYAYNAQGQMISRITTYINTEQVTNFFYVGGILVADSTYYYDGGLPFDYSYSTFQSTNGDVSFIQTINPEDSTDSIMLTYSSAPNPFKQLSLFDWTQGLQNIDIVSPFTYFDQHALAGYSDNSQSIPVVETATYTFNTANQVTEAKSVETYGANITETYDWVITYQ